MIDLRSDTVTKPTKGMLQAMMQAEVGDDVFGEDPTVNKLQDKVSNMFGMEAGLFVPSGVMSNQLAIKVLTKPGEEIIVDHKGHIFNYETSAAAMISSVQINPLQGSYGKLKPKLIAGALRAGNDWEPKPSVVVIENTTNKGGGACYTRQELEGVYEKAKELELSIHLDGARIWNAMVASKIEPDFFGSVADTIAVSFSKGLGAPVGSMLLSSYEKIKEARRYRKMLGGGMRQVGLLAAAADYAIENHLAFLAEDHRRARELANTIQKCKHLSIDAEAVETNIVIFEVREGEVSSAIMQLEERGIRMVPFGPRSIRATFHFEIGDSELQKTQRVLTNLFG